MTKLEYTPIGIKVDKSEATKIWESDDYRPFPKDSVVYQSNRHQFFLDGKPKSARFVAKKNLLVRFLSDLIS